MRASRHGAILMLVLTGGSLVQIHAQSVPSAPQPQIQQAPVAPAMSSSPSAAACASFHDQSVVATAKHDYAAAAAALRKAVTVCTNQARLTIDLAKAEMLAKQFDAAEKTLSPLLAMQPHNVDALLVQGELFYLIGKSPEAIAALREAVAAAPANAETHYVLGRIYYQQSSLQLAKLQFQKTLQLDTTVYKAYDGLALCYENLGAIEQAAQTYMQGIAAVYKAHPDYDVIYADFAELMLRFNESQKALELAAEAVQRNPHVPRNYLLAGRALEQAGKPRDSLRWLLRAAQMDPTYPDPHLQLARVYRKLGEDAEAKQESTLFEKLSAQAPPVRR